MTSYIHKNKLILLVKAMEVQSFSLAQILSNKKFCDFFEEYLESRSTGENITLWKSIENFKQIENSHLRTANAKTIIEKFFRRSSSSTLKISDDIKKQQISIYECLSMPPSPDLFQITQNSLKSFLQAQCREFKKTKIYKHFIKRIWREGFRKAFTHFI